MYVQYPSVSLFNQRERREWKHANLRGMYTKPCSCAYTNMYGIYFCQQTTKEREKKRERKEEASIHRNKFTCRVQIGNRPEQLINHRAPSPRAHPARTHLVVVAAVDEHLCPRPVGRVESLARHRHPLDGLGAYAVRLERLGVPTHDPSKHRPAEVAAAAARKDILLFYFQHAIFLFFNM